MHLIPRRTVLRSALALPLLGSAFSSDGRKMAPGRTVHVPANEDRFGERRRVFSALPIDRKVAATDTSGGLLLIEQVDDRKGGPPRHLHHGQEEWFYVVDGHYAIEVAAERFELTAGDSLLAPRGVPHAWAHISEGVGRMLIGFQPAGRMEAFFEVATKLDGIPAGPELARLFGDHGMQLVGPPLAIG